MINFSKWLNLKEAAASDDVLMNYYKHIEKNLNLDDIRTLISMMKQTRDQRTSNVIPLILKELKKNIFRLHKSKQEQALEEIEDAENEIIRRWRSNAREFEDEMKTNFNPTIYDRATQYILGDKDDDHNWAQEVTNYMKDNLDVDLDDLEEEDPILNKAYDMIFDQHETGILDTRSTAEKVAKFVKDQLGQR